MGHLGQGAQNTAHMRENSTLLYGASCSTVPTPITDLFRFLNCLFVGKTCSLQEVRRSQRSRDQCPMVT